MANNSNPTQSQEELKQQQEMYRQQMAMYQKQQMMYQVNMLLQNIDRKSVLEAISRYYGPGLSCPNYWISTNLVNKVKELFADESSDGIIIKAQNILLYAINLTNSIRSQNMYATGMMGGNMNMGMGMNPMMMGGMNQFGMGQMGGFGMNQFGMGMNPMMGGYGMGMNQFGMNQFQQPQQNNNEAVTEEQKIKVAHEYINNMIYQADPIVYLLLLISSGIDVDFSTDQNFDMLVTQAIYAGICNLANTNPQMFNMICYQLQALYQTEYFQKMQKGNGNKNGQQNQFGMGMNPMMGGYGMGMNPMMMGGMNPMMSGMMSGMDQNGMNMGMGMNPMMMGGMGPGPMMGMGMNFMPGMTGTMGMNTQMPGMNSGNNGCMW